MKTKTGTLILIALVSLGLPATADDGAYVCTVLAGTGLPGPSGGTIGAFAMTPAGGLGECHLHTLSERSELTGIETPEGCQLFVDTDEDAHLEEAAIVDQAYGAETSFVALCQLGVTMADNRITLAPA